MPLGDLNCSTKRGSRHDPGRYERDLAGTHLRTPSFKAGVDDVRTGRSARFDFYRGFEYERGRQWAKLAPPTMPLRLGRRLNPHAVALFRKLLKRGYILP
jgi:hypothetical protein